MSKAYSKAPQIMIVLLCLQPRRICNKVLQVQAISETKVNYQKKENPWI